MGFVNLGELRPLDALRGGGAEEGVLGWRGGERG